MNQNLKRVVRITSGWTFLLLGAAGIFLPLLQGLLFLTVGVILLAPYIRTFRKLQYLLYKHFPHLRGVARRLRAKYGYRSVH